MTINAREQMGMVNKKIKRKALNQKKEIPHRFHRTNKKNLENGRRKK